jgi:hypothetical protein
LSAPHEWRPADRGRTRLCSLCRQAVRCWPVARSASRAYSTAPGRSSSTDLASGSIADTSVLRRCCSPRRPPFEPDDRERHLLWHGPARTTKEVPTPNEFVLRFVEEHCRANRHKASGLHAKDRTLRLRRVRTTRRIQQGDRFDTSLLVLLSGDAGLRSGEMIAIEG